MSAEEENVNLEAKLRAVELPAANVNRDRLMFAAGAAAERAASARGRNGWRIVSAFSAAMAAGLALFVGLRPMSERVVYVERSQPPTAAVVTTPISQLPERLPAEMIQLRELALKGEWRDPLMEQSPSRVVTSTSLPRFDLKKAAGEAFPTDGRM